MARASRVASKLCSGRTSRRTSASAGSCSCVSGSRPKQLRHVSRQSCTSYMKSLRFAAILCLLLSLLACSGNAHPVNLPAPVESTTLGVGDEFELRIAGEDKLPLTYVVAPDGTV